MAIFCRLIAIFAVLSSCFPAACAIQQPVRPKPPQTPRQALIEIITGGSKAVQKHATVEIQQMISEASKNASDKTARQMLVMFQEYLTLPSLMGEKGLHTFDSGPVLLSFGQANEKQKLEVRLEADDLSGDLDTMQLSIHLFKDGQEQSIPFMPIIVVGLKQQEKVWRLNEIGGNARVIVGDPRFFTDLLKFQQSDEQETQQAKKSSEEVKEKPERPKLPASSIVSMLAYAEMSYARTNPDVGFTCNLAELANLEGSGFSEMLDPQVATGSYNGYRFTIFGCDGKPAAAFHIIAEPVGAGSQAFCTDPTHNLRVSDDGRGGTCLASGRVMKTEANLNAD